MSQATEKSAAPQLEPPRIENGKAMVVAGLQGHYTASTSTEGIPALWQGFAPHIGKLPAQTGRNAYGLILNASNMNEKGMDYLAGVEVSSTADLPAGFSVVRIPAQRYAVFAHREHVSKIPNTVEAIFRQWLPSSGHEAVRAGSGAPDFFERYTEEFDPRVAIGGTEIWLPIT